MAVLLTFFAGCGGDDDNPVNPGTTDQFEVVRTALDAYVAGADAPTLSAQSLYDNMQDGDTSNDYHVLSVRTEGDYAIGHVPGAANIPWKEVADQTKISVLPTTGKIAVYCYTGHTAGVATTVLRALGYETYNMKYGIMAWTTNGTIRVQAPFDEATDAHDFPTETTDNTPATGTYDLPDLDVTSSSDETTILLAAANAYLQSGDSPTLSAQSLYDNMQDGDATNDYFVVSVRSKSHYDLGHVPGAINIPWKEVTMVDRLKKIPPEAKIAVYCYTGHTAAVATTALRMMGYEAYNIKYGICAWTTDTTIRAQTTFSEATEAHDFPTEP